jgi:myo-inositol-1-phosphate synthase
VLDLFGLCASVRDHGDVVKKIRTALVGAGNCASSLVQGVSYYSDPQRQAHGLIHSHIGGYGPSDIEFVLAIDTDARKVGLDLSEAIFAAPNCTTVFQHELGPTGVQVMMGRLLDGMADHMLQAPGDRGFVRAEAPEATGDEIVAALKKSGAEVLVNYLPVGSEEASRFYMECALEAGVAVVNCIPVFIASDPEWERRFRDRRLPIVGDDIKAQLGATIVHRVLSSLFRQRGVRVDHTYQLNTGGNTDFLNMLDRGRLASKKESKTEAVLSVMEQRLTSENIHVGPSDYVPWLNDNKLCFLRMEGELFGGVPMNVELRLSVEDSPNSAACVLDAIRCCKVALERGEGGVLVGPSAYFCKHPPQQFTDDVAAQLTEEFIAGQALAAE